MGALLPAIVKMRPPSIFVLIATTSQRSALGRSSEAISLDPDSAIAHMRLGWALCFMRQYDQALSSFEMARTLGPEISELCAYYGQFLNFLDRADEGLDLLDKAYRLDPVNRARLTICRIGATTWLGKMDAPTTSASKGLKVMQFSWLIRVTPQFSGSLGSSRCASVTPAKPPPRMTRCDSAIGDCP